MRICRCPSKEQLALDAALAGADRIRAALHKKGSAVIVDLDSVDGMYPGARVAMRK